MTSLCVFPRRTRRLGLAAVSLLALAACTVGPEHVRPDSPLPDAFDQAQADAYPASAVGTQVWAAFDEPELDLLIARALAANSAQAQALARLDEARALAGLSKYSLFPTVTAAVSAERSNPSRRDPMIPVEQGRSDTWRAGFDAVWEIDLFGSLRRQRDAINREVEARAAALDAVRLSLVAETAQAWFALRGNQQRLALLHRYVTNLQENLEILRRQLDAGRGTELDVARSHALGLQVASELPLLEAEVVRQEQRLAVLTGWPVATVRSHLAPHKALPPLPDLVAVGTPQDWLARRPDIREAERKLAVEVARIGVETAEFFPKLTLVGDFGGTARRLGDLGSADAQRWRFGPSLNWSFLDFGRVRQRVQAQSARADGAMALYQETLLRALEETENALAGYRATNASASALELAVAESRKAAELARLRFDAGASDYLVVLDAERSLITLEDTLAQTSTRRATNLAAVYKALAGDFAAAP